MTKRTHDSLDGQGDASNDGPSSRSHSGQELAPVEEETALGLEGLPTKTFADPKRLIADALAELSPAVDELTGEEAIRLDDDSDIVTAVAAKPDLRYDGTPMDASAAPKALGWRIVRGFLAPILAGAAVWMHMALNVPDQPVVVASADQGGANKAPRNRAPQRRPPERNPDQMTVSWDRWSVEPFEGEPIKGKWGRQTQSLVSKSVVVARQFAFAGAPEAPHVIALENQCRTIRCRFVLRSPFKNEVDLVAQTLEHLRANGEPVFRHVEYEVIDAPDEQMPRDDHYLQVTVGINIDGVMPTEVEVDPAYEEGAKAVPMGDTDVPPPEEGGEDEAAPEVPPEKPAKKPTPKP